MLSESQLALMRILWQRPESSVNDVVEAMREQRSLAHTTVATMLSRLENVDWFEPEKVVNFVFRHSQQI